MSTPTRVRSYEGIVESQADMRYRADADLAARHGWYPTDRQWDGTTLRVTYTYSAPVGAPAERPAEGLPERSARGYPWSGRERVLVPLGLVALLLWLAVGFGAMSGSVRFQLECIRIQWSQDRGEILPSGCPDLRFPVPTTRS